MLTRLKVSGFKNLMDVDVRFGPFTCIAGANGTGKSNLFDAIRFLSALADKPLVEAALSVRSEGDQTWDIRNLFHRVGDTYDDQMSFEAEMIVPRHGVDDLGKEVEARATFLRYSLTLAYRKGSSDSGFQPDRLEIIKEELVAINKREARKRLLFPYSDKWRKSAVQGEDRDSDLISTQDEPNQVLIGIRSEPPATDITRYIAERLPRTVLSSAMAYPHPTVFLTRREMQSWRLLQLEPSALRKSDDFFAPTRLGSDGSHLAATLYHLARSSRDPQQVYTRVANRLAELLDDVGKVWVDRDDQRGLYTLYLTGRDATSHAARALSDGTLRFLALVVFEQDTQEQGLLCLEEPENGIHPRPIPAVIRLLQDFATDTAFSVDDPGNPLRQVIVNTHSPYIVQQVPDDSLLVSELRDTLRQGQHFNRAFFSYLPDTWRHRPQEVPDGQRNIVAKGKLLDYLGYVRPEPQQERVIDRADIQQLL